MALFHSPHYQRVKLPPRRITQRAIANAAIRGGKQSKDRM
jgi:hypothetical protein